MKLFKYVMVAELLLAPVVACAMQKEDSIQSNAASQQPIDAVVLKNTLTTLSEIGKKDSYILVYLKSLCGFGERDNVDPHNMKILFRNKDTYANVLKEYNIMDQDGAINERIKGIAGKAICVSACYVDLKKPESPDWISGEDDDMGGVDYGNGDVVTIKG